MLIAVLPPTELIDLREQGRRDLDEAAAALEDRAGEADQIADHAAAQRDDMIAALDAELEQPVGQRLELAQLLVPSPGGSTIASLRDARRGQRRLQRREMRRDDSRR